MATYCETFLLSAGSIHGEIRMSVDDDWSSDAARAAAANDFLPAAIDGVCVRCDDVVRAGKCTGCSLVHDRAQGVRAKARLDDEVGTHDAEYESPEARHRRIMRLEPL